MCVGLGTGRGEEGDSDGVSSDELSSSEPEDEEMVSVMQEMDQELAKTSIGKSFTKMKVGLLCS